MLPLAWTLLSLALGQERRIALPDDATLDGPSERDRTLWAVERDDVLSPADAALCARAPRGLARPAAAWCAALAEERALRRAWAEQDEGSEDERAAAATRLREAEAREGSRRASLTAELRRQGGGPWATLLEARLALRIAEDRAAPEVAPLDGAIYESDGHGLRPAEPVLDYHAAVDLYRGLIASYPTPPEADVARYMLGYCLGRPAAMPYAPGERQALLAELLEGRPSARLAAGADYLLGREHLFAGAPDQAVASFQRVVDRGPRGPLYARALLALARASARIASNPVEVDQALDQHARLIEETPRLRRRGGAPPGLDPVREMAATVLALADRGVIQEGDAGPVQTPMDLALSWIAANGEPAWSRALAVSVGDLLVTQARTEEAIAARRAALARWPLDAQAPALQRQIAQLYVSAVPPRLDLAREALVELAATYGEGSAWAVANRKHPEAVAEARVWVAEALVVVGTNLHELGDPPGVSPGLLGSPGGSPGFSWGRPLTINYSADR